MGAYDGVETSFILLSHYIILLFIISVMYTKSLKWLL